MTDLFAARSQMAMSLAFHIVFAALGIALPPGGGRRAVGRHQGAGAVFLQTLTAASGLGALAALWGWHWRLARFAAQGEAGCLVWGWAWAQFPYVIPPGGTAASLAAPRATLVPTLGTLAAGTAILLPSFVYPFRVFKRAEPETPFERVDAGGTG